ncbi:LysE family translocator [Acinetobacter guerrae]|nr:LysE family translocator [Acinetobacter guerrae]
MNIHIWILFFLAYLGITLSPGPNVLIVLSHASKYGLRSIAITIFANLTCQLIIIAFISLGIGALFTTNSQLYYWIKYAGAIYLIFLGLKILYKTFIKQDITGLNLKNPTSPEFTHAPFYKRYAEAFAVSASNPKTVIFLSAFLPQFITAGQSIFLQFSLIYITIACVVILIHTLYAIILIKMKRRMNRKLNTKFFPRISAMIYVFLGVSLGLSK